MTPWLGAPSGRCPLRRSLPLPPPDDAALACAGRLRAGRARGERALVLVLFEEEAAALVEAVSELGADVAVAGLAPAARRHRGRALPCHWLSGGPPEDADLFEALVRLLADVGPRIRPRQVCVPLGLGGHIDHRLVHEAALQALVDEPGRNVFLYEERPEAFAPVRSECAWACMGARLPPGATEAAERAGLARYLLRVQCAPVLRGDLRDWSDRFSTFGAAAGEWRSARGWNPQKAFGPRLQPVVQAGDPEAAEGAVALLGRLLPDQAARGAAVPNDGGPWLPPTRASSGAGEYAERYWLVLPALHGVADSTRREDLEMAASAR